MRSASSAALLDSAQRLRLRRGPLPATPRTTAARRALLVFALILAPVASSAVPPAQAAAQSEGWRAPVGVPVHIRGLVLPAPELEPVPQARENPLVVRVLAVAPHGTAFRYDIELYGLDPGLHDLGDYLQTGDGSPRGELPELPVAVESVLPAGQMRPNPIQPAEPPAIGGYRLTMILLGILWGLGLVVILASGRRQRAAARSEVPRPPSVADRLRPLVERALAGTLGREERARLELTLIAFWRKRLGLERESAASSLARIREHPEAGPLLTAFEEWLHRPAPARDVDLGALLAPYRDLPAEDLEEAPA